MTQLAARDVGRWAPGFGDPTAYGWAMVGAYLIAAVLCGQALRAARRNPPVRGQARLTILLTATGLTMLMLAINKQLDLQSGFTQLGKDLAKAQGWYDQRRAIQQWFVLGITAMGLALIAAGLVLLGGLWSRAGLLWIGLAVTLSFVILRAASFHHADHFFAQSLGPLRVNVILEVTGITLVALGAIRCARPRNDTQHPTP